jgi:hypothetical protein
MISWRKFSMQKGKQLNKHLFLTLLRSSGLYLVLKHHCTSVDKLDQNKLISFLKILDMSEPVLLNVYGAPELIPRNEFRQPMCLAGWYKNPISPRCLAPIDFLKIPALYTASIPACTEPVCIICKPFLGAQCWNFLAIYGG